MAEYANREYYIPLRKEELIRLLCRDERLTPAEREEFKQFCRLVGAVFHFEYHVNLEVLKDAYAPFDPDRDTKPIEAPDAQVLAMREQQLRSALAGLMARANFKQITREDVEKAVTDGASDWGLNMEVDFRLFELLEMFVRGEGKTRRFKHHPIWFWRKQEKEVETYQRLAILLKLRPHKKMPANIDTSHVFLKLFKDIPKLDLEMVLPGARIRMPGLQRGKLGVSLLGSIGYVLYSAGWQIWMAFKTLLGLTTSALTAGATLLWGPAVALGGYGYKQWYSYQVTKQTYSKQLTESLYFQTLDNNAGVMSRIFDEAHEQECRETFLAYLFLWKHAPPGGWTAEQLDDYVEMWLEGTVGLKVDFEIGDAVHKLTHLGIIEKEGDHYRAAPLNRALEILDHTWDNYFQYNNPSRQPA
jgi:hypothetical protein